MVRARLRLSLLSLAALCSLALGALPLAAAPASPEYQEIIGTVTWSGNSSIDTDVVVTNGATLQIDGTALVYASNNEQGTAYPGGLNPYKIEIIVESGGYLHIDIGAQLIANAPGDWYGIVFLPGSNGLIDSALIRNGIVGVTILGDASPTVMGCTIRDMQGPSPGFPPGSNGDMAAGIVISGASSANVFGNIITHIRGGHGAAGAHGEDGMVGGGAGQDGGDGGSGGPAYGILLQNGAISTVSSNTITDVVGGSGSAGGHGGNGAAGWEVVPPGGAGGAGGNGGRGGAAIGIAAHSAGAAALIKEHTIGDLKGGSGGRGGDGGAAGNGYSCSARLLAAAGPGGDGGAGGAGGGGGYGGQGMGLYIDGGAPTVQDNTISTPEVSGGAPEVGGNGGRGGAGGRGCDGASEEDGGPGGPGGNGGYGGPGGTGGSAFGVAIEGSSTAVIRHNAVSATIRGGGGQDGGSGGEGGAGGDGGNGGGGMGNPAGAGGNGGSGGSAGGGGNAGFGGTAAGITVLGGQVTMARNRVTALVGGMGYGLGGVGGVGGSGGNGGLGGTGAFSGAGGSGGTGGAGGNGGIGAEGGSALGGVISGAHRLENNLVHSFAGNNGAGGGNGGSGGPGGSGGDAGNENAQAGDGGNGGSGGDGADGGNSGTGAGFILLSGNATVVHNTVNNIGTNINPGGGGAGGNGGAAGSAGTIGLPGTPGNGGGIGNPGLIGDEGSAYGLCIETGQPAVVNNIVTATGVGRTHGGAASSYGIFAANGPLTLALDYNDVWGWGTANYYQVTPGAHDIAQDPLFVDVNTGNYHLQAGSPCRNTGTSSFSGLTLPADDLDGNSRPQGTSHDMGAYEYVEGGAPAYRVFLPIVQKH